MLGADEVAVADLNSPETLEPALAGARGAFVVTNFWEAREIGDIMSSSEAHTYFGPHVDDGIALARDVSTAPPTSLADWAPEHLPLEGGAP